MDVLFWRSMILVCAVITAPVVGNAQVATMPLDEAKAITPRQQAWTASTIQERVQIAEVIGDEAVRTFAKAKGFETIYDGFDRAIPQGPDQVYRGGGGIVHVFEAKGGSGQLGHAYGHPQGSAEWAVDSAKRVRSSTKATSAEKRAAQEILTAASRGKMEVHVVRTSHVLGEPSAAVLEQSAGTTPAARRMAADALNGATKTGSTAVKRGAGSTDGVAAAVRGASGKALRSAAKATVVVGVVVDGGMRVNDAVDVEKRYAHGELSKHERVVKHAGNAGGFGGGWGGALAGAKGGAVAGGIIGAPFGGVGAPIGAGIGGAIGGIGGYWAGEKVGTEAAEAAADMLHGD
jgi:hypothetical protein